MSKLIGVAVGMLGLLVAAGAQAGEAWDFTTPGNSYSDGSWDFGAAFYVNTTITATGLGYYADPTTGLVASNPVALYACVGGGVNCIGSSSSLLATATVTNTYPEFGHFRFVTIPSVVLTPGWYQVDGVSNVQNYTWDDPGFFTDPAITYNANSDLWQSDGTNTPFFLNYVPSEQETDGFWGPDVFFGTPVFTTVPEPASIALLGVSLLGLGMVRRRKT